MQSLSETIQGLGGTLTEVGGILVPARFSRPEATHRAVRSGVGVTRHPWGVLTVSGEDRGTFLDDTLTCTLPEAEGDVNYGFLLDPDGAIKTDLYLVDAGDRYLCLTAPGTAASLADSLSSRTFIQDVTVDDVTQDHVLFGIHGPAAQTKLNSVMPQGTPPAEALAMERGIIREQGVTVVRLDAPTGERGYVAICRNEDGASVFDALVNLGALATPFGYDTWRALTLEAGTPLYETELTGRTPNVCGQLTAGVSLEKGCFIGQEAVARVANLATPRHRLFGLRASTFPEAPAEVTIEGHRPGTLTRETTSPILDSAIAMALLPADIDVGSVVSVGKDEIEAKVVPLPFVEGGEGSARCPQYDG